MNGLELIDSVLLFVLNTEHAVELDSELFPGVTIEHSSHSSTPIVNYLSSPRGGGFGGDELAGGELPNHRKTVSVGPQGEESHHPHKERMGILFCSIKGFWHFGTFDINRTKRWWVVVTRLSGYLVDSNLES